MGANLSLDLKNELIVRGFFKEMKTQWNGSTLIKAFLILQLIPYLNDLKKVVTKIFFVLVQLGSKSLVYIYCLGI